MGMISVNPFFFSFADNYSVQFDGIDEYCACDLPTAHKLSAITVSLWFKIAILGTDKQLVALMPTGTGGVGKGLLLLVTSTNVLQVYQGTGAGYNISTGTTVISVDTWYNAVATFDTTNGTKVYLNGTLEASNANLTAISWTDLVSPPNYPSPAQLYFGAFKTNALNFGATIPNAWYHIGKLNEIAIWSKALTLAEAQEVDNSGSPSSLNNHSAVANLVSWYRPSVSTYPTIEDVKGGYDVTMVNQEAGDIQNDVP